jgi:hypothetical protein
MPSISETGHAKNVANFKKFILVCQGYGSKYIPSKTAIKVASMQTRATDAEAMIDDLKTLVRNNKTAINNRKAAFKGYNKFATRILNALKATDATVETKDNAISINKKIQGIRITEPKVKKTVVDGKETTTDNSISTSQQAFTSIVDHFKDLKKLLEAQATVYTPNETDLQITAIVTYVNNLDTLNTAADTATVATSNKRIARDHSFYDETTGLVATVNAAKDYIASVYTKNSPEYKLASAIQFTQPKKK